MKPKLYFKNHILMVLCKTAVTPLITQWSYCSLALIYRHTHHWNIISLQARHNGHDGISNHRPHHCLLNCLFRFRSNEYQSSLSLAFVQGIHRWPVNSPHKWPVTRKMFSFDDIIMMTSMYSPYQDNVIEQLHTQMYVSFIALWHL